MKKNEEEVKKLNFFERAWLRAMMPNLKKYKKKYSEELTNEDNYVVLNRQDYELMKKMIDRQDNYINEIKINVEEIEKLKEEKEKLIFLISEFKVKIKNKETERRKTAGKVGGITAKLNNMKKENKILLEKFFELENILETKDFELEKERLQNKILKDNGKKKQIEDFKKLVELNKDIKKHKK